MTLYTVTIVGVSAPVEVYAGLTATKDYVGAMLGDGATAWAALTDDGKSKVLVQATRYVDRQSWSGTANAAGGTTLAFPRDSLLDSAGATISNATQLAAVARAIGELCAIGADDIDALSLADTGANVKGVGAGSARVDYFNPTSVAAGTATRLPTAVQQILGAYLSIAGGVVAVTGFSSAGSANTDFDEDDDLGRRDVGW